MVVVLESFALANLSFYYSNRKESCIVFFFMQAVGTPPHTSPHAGGRHDSPYTSPWAAGTATPTPRREMLGLPAGRGGWRGLSAGGDFGRELENLSAPANTQRCAATDGSTNPGRAMDGSSGVLASAFHSLPQGHLEFLIPAQRNPSRKPPPPTPHQPANPAPHSHKKSRAIHAKCH